MERPEMYRGYCIAITWCFAVYERVEDPEPGQRKWAFVLGFWNIEEAREYIDGLVDDD